jgi:hypothetical protein
MHPREYAVVHTDIQLRSADNKDDEMSEPSMWWENLQAVRPPHLSHDHILRYKRKNTTTN